VFGIAILALTAAQPAANAPREQILAALQTSQERLVQLSTQRSTPREAVMGLVAAGHLRSEISCYSRAIRTFDPIESKGDESERAFESGFLSGDALRAQQSLDEDLAPLDRCLKRRMKQTVDILDVDVSRPDRATVKARVRNVSFIPEGVQLESSYAAKRRDGEVYRYELIRSADGWKLTQAYSSDLGEDRPAFEAGDEFGTRYWFTMAY
jgi:hypothetical protein